MYAGKRVPLDNGIPVPAQEWNHVCARATRSVVPVLMNPKVSRTHNRA